MKIYLKFIVLLVLLVFSIKPQYAAEILKKDKIKVLILSGMNNHDWQKTTPFLANIFQENGFEIEVSNRPDTMKYKNLKEFDALVSNWNSFPDNDLVWPDNIQKDLLRFLNEGGGLVFFHSSTSCLYKWPEFKKISTGAWVEDTWHGKPSWVKVKIENQEHLITKGIPDFYTFDELWINAEQNSTFEVLGSALNDTILSKGLEKQPVIFVSNYGKGRIFHTTLGHDIIAMSNPDFQMLLLRGTEWAASSKVRSSFPN